jgi:hypothetical protein
MSERLEQIREAAIKTRQLASMGLMDKADREWLIDVEALLTELEAKGREIGRLRRIVAGAIGYRNAVEGKALNRIVAANKRELDDAIACHNAKGMAWGQGDPPTRPPAHVEGGET